MKKNCHLKMRQTKVNRVGKITGVDRMANQLILELHVFYSNLKNDMPTRAIFSSDLFTILADCFIEGISHRVWEEGIFYHVLSLLSTRHLQFGLVIWQKQQFIWNPTALRRTLFLLGTYQCSSSWINFPFW